MGRRVKDATELEPGDRIVTRPGRVERVTGHSTRDQYGGVTIHTEGHDLTTTLPCPVKMEE